MAVMTAARRWLRPVLPGGLSATLAGWLAATVRSEFVLCEPEPSKTLLDWTAVGGPFTNTYQIAFERFHQTDVIDGGMYGLVIGVVQDATEIGRASCRERV